MPYPLTPNAPYSYSPAYGGIPAVPSPISTAQEAIGGNIGNLGGLYQLAGGVNRFNQQQAPLGLQTNLPGYQGMIGQSSQNIMSHLGGQIPQDVINQITQQAAERGTATGLAGSPNSSAALLAALGKTSIGLQSQGEQELTGAIARTPQGPLFDPSKFFVTPDQEQQAQAAADLYKSAPVPSAAAAEARNQANAGIGATVGGGAPQLPVGSPFKATSWGGATPSGDSAGTGLTYGGQTYYGGATPASAQTNWNQWYGNLPQSTPLGVAGQPSTTYMGSANPLWADEYDQMAGLGGVTGAPAAGTVSNPVTNTSNLDPFMGLGSFFGGPTGQGYGATEPASGGGSVGELLSTLSPVESGYFM